MSGETFRVEADLDVRDSESYIFFRQCTDNSLLDKEMHSSDTESCLERLEKRRRECFDTCFLVRWDQWEKTTDIFSRIDTIFKWYKVHLQNEKVSRKLFKHVDDNDKECDCNKENRPPMTHVYYL